MWYYAFKVDCNEYEVYKQAGNSKLEFIGFFTEDELDKIQNLKKY